MKRFSCFLVIFLISYCYSECQVSLGMQFGQTRSRQFYGEPVPDPINPYVNGVNGSFIFNYSINSSWSIGLEPGIIERGASCVPGSFFIPRPQDVRNFLTYYEIPLFVRHEKSILNERLLIMAKVGYSVSYLRSIVQEIYDLETGEAISSERPGIGPGWGFFRRFDHGINGGLSIGTQLGKGILLVTWRQYLGLVDAEYENVSKNWSRNLSLAYEYRFGGKK
ncbi:MAG: hypothetical protein MRZ79_15300 [Bacteroidia bacterium]|nr:hypothetical protein [Bacteroidia bacterium]